ncbi:MAG: hypothetical protein ACPGNP_06330, partial [Acidimicrobiales bacterium]
MFSTDPDVDPRKCVVGLACAAQAVADGHQVQAFFASHAVRLLHADYIDAIDARVGMPDGSSRAMVEQLATMSQQRQKIIARNFANSFLKPLYHEIYCLCVEN